MGSICILTDSSAQFPQLGFAGRNDVRVMPFDIEFNGKLYEEGQNLHTNDLPASANEESHPRLIAPPREKFEELYLNLTTHYQDILVILTSASLNPAFQNAHEAAEAVKGRARVSVVDSQTTSVGLGLLVQTASEAIARGQPAADVERLVRSLIPRIYMMICVPGLSWLYHAGFVDQAQAFVGEMLALMPIFTLEEGQISAVEKVRNARSLVDFMQEFVCEFDDLQHIAFIQSVPALSHEARMMREHAQNCFPQTPFSEHNINLPLATLVGPRSVGLVAVEKINQPRHY
jgi:DegV family protein with EDD domain